MKIAFWAYKGGTGRSLLLANIGIELAKRGQNVGMIDMDYEAPGLHVIYDLEKDDIEKRGHFIDILLQKSTVNLGRFIIDLKSKVPTKGGIYLLPTIDDTRLDQIKWDQDLFRFILNASNDFIKYYQLDHLLIDTRTGFSTLSNFGKLLSDLMVVTMRPNRQNILGVLDAIRGFEIEGMENYLIVCSEVPETAKTKSILRKIEQELQRKIDATIPYDDSLAFDEKLLIVEDPNSLISKEYKKIVDLIVKRKWI